MTQHAPGSRWEITRTRNRIKYSCTECRRRKQKCIPNKSGPCSNCARRYPPVECVGRPWDTHAPASSASASSRSSSSDGLPRRERTVGRNSPVLVPVRIVPSPVPLWDEKEDSDLDGRRVVTPSSSGSGISTPSLLSAPLLAEDTDSSLMVYKRKESYFEAPQVFGGSVLTAINALNGTPIAQNARNVELYHFFHNHVAARLLSIDGSSNPVPFAREICQFPLMPSISILLASATQTQELESSSEIMSKRGNETLVLKSFVLGLINQLLRQDFGLVGGEALRAVLHLAILEWFWGTGVNIWAHMKGIKQMVGLCGGLEALKITDPMLAQILLVADFELACAFDRDLCLQDSLLASTIPIPLQETYPASVISPMFPFPTPTTFSSKRGVLGITLSTSSILDSILHLSNSITSTSTSTYLSTSTHATNTATVQKIQSQAWEMNTRFTSLHQLPNDEIAQIILLTAKYYTHAISTLTPFPNLLSPDQLYEIYHLIVAVPLSRWQEVPGIFLWILTTLSPSTKDDTIGRWIRRKMAISGITVGMNTDFHFASACLRAFWLVERWVISSSSSSRLRMVEEKRGLRIVGDERGVDGIGSGEVGLGLGVRLVYERGVSGEGIVEI